MITRTIVFAGALVVILGGLAARAPARSAQSSYAHIMSSGPVGLPSTARSVDWTVLNDSPDSQIVRVSVYELHTGGAKTVLAPGPLTHVLLPTSSTHNANSVSTTGPFRLGFAYEIVVELNDRRVLPTVDVWRTHGADVIPGTHLSPQDFSDIK